MNLGLIINIITRSIKCACSYELRYHDAPAASVSASIRIQVDFSVASLPGQLASSLAIGLALVSLLTCVSEVAAD